jgi:hypothetical protein
VFIDNDFPKILGAELYRPHPAYIAEMAVEPVVVHDFTRQPGQTVQLDRYKFWGTPGTKDSRERIADQTIGTANSRNITKEKVLVVLKEYTGPSDSAFDLQDCSRNPDHGPAPASGFGQPEYVPPVDR